MPESPDQMTSEGTVTHTCGLVMPISACDGCSAEHWLEVRSIIEESIRSISEPTFVPRLVSEADDIGIIHKRIVQGLHDSRMVVCDVSGKNANVMFELGMRLAFDKPVVIIKDDKTDYSFDTGVIEHLTYPRDLRFKQIVAFKELLASKVKSTYATSLNKDHPTFLKSFGTFKVASLEQDVVPPETLFQSNMIDAIQDLIQQVSALRRESDKSGVGPLTIYSDDIVLRLTQILDIMPTSSLEEAYNDPRTFIKDFAPNLPKNISPERLRKLIREELQSRRVKGEPEPFDVRPRIKNKLMGE